MGANPRLSINQVGKALVEPSPNGTPSTSGDTISLSEWLNDSSIGKGSQRTRKQILQLFEKHNGATMPDILRDISASKASVYNVSKNFMDGIRKTHAPYTCYIYRSLLPGMFESLLGEGAFSKKKYDRLVPNGKAYITHIKAIPERSQVVEMLKIAPPLSRALIGFLSVSGMRIGEALSRKWSELEIRPEGYVRIKLQAKDTKAKYDRYTFLTREIVEWLKAVRAVKDSQWLFPGVNGEHLSHPSATRGIKSLYRKIGCLDKPDNLEAYTIHSLRTLAGDLLRECGLSDRDTLSIIGHKAKLLGAEVSYVDPKKLEANWKTHCAENMCFLDDSSTAQKQVAELTRTNGKLEALLEKLLERLT